MENIAKKIISIFLALVLTIIPTSIVFADSENIDEDSEKELTPIADIEITSSKKVPRIGEKLQFTIDGLSKESITNVTENYLEVFNFEKIQNMNALKFENMKIPDVKVERYINGQWINDGITRVLKIHSDETGFINIKEVSTKKDGKSEMIISRKDIEDELEKIGEDYTNLKSYHFKLYNLNPNGETDWSNFHGNKIIYDGSLEFNYEIVDEHTEKNYATFQGGSIGYKNYDQEDIPLPKNWLYYETSDIKLELADDEKDKVFKPGEVVKLKATVNNTSSHIPNQRLYSTIDFGEKDIVKNPEFTPGNPNAYLNYTDTDSSMIPGVLSPGEKIEFNTSVKIPENITKDMLNNKGQIVITPALLTSNIKQTDKGNISELSVNEREYNEPLLLDMEQQNLNINFNANGGKFTDDTIEKTEVVKKNDVFNSEKVEKPKRDGYKFINWYEKDNNGNLEDTPFNFDIEITEDITLYAKWKKIEKPTEPTKPTDPTETVDIDTVILANGTKYTDVLTATVLGNELKAPILLSTVNEIDSKTKAEIKRLNPKEIIISGGENSVSEKIKIELEKEGYKVRRISGIDRYKTAEEIAKEVRALTGVKDEIMLVDGTNFPDVITLSPYASNKHTPILLTEPNSLNNTTKKALKEFEIEEITIGGEKDSVSKEIEKFLKADYKVSRIGGIDRYETASLIAKEVRKQTGNKDDLIIVDGTDFPDGITISSLANKYQSPIHLTNPKELTEITSKDIKDFKIKNITIGGGENSVSKAIENELKAQEIVTNRIAGIDRYATAVEISKEFKK